MEIPVKGGVLHFSDVNICCSFCAPVRNKNSQQIISKCSEQREYNRLQTYLSEIQIA